MKNIGTTDTASLTNHKPEPHIRRCPSESITLGSPPTPMRLSLVGCTSSSHAIG
uniref:Uncharacterized protein n=1 Tax=Mesocestoides corti TaxID=53468 RepID=A0A5K3FY04_MESCO